MNNPFEAIANKLSILDSKVDLILNQPKEDNTNKYYTYHEAAEILKCKYQTIRNRVNAGILKAVKDGPRRKLIHHDELFDSLGEVKSIKYKR